jgi:SAM-dependent methyltransferase
LESHEYTVEKSGYAADSLFALELDFLVKNSYSSAVIWEPSPVLKGVIDTIESLRAASGEATRGVAVDLGCGSGRDCVFLALRNWISIGYDYMDESLERAKALAARYGTEIETVTLDLEAHPELASQHKADLVNVARYLHRPLFPVIAEMVNPGGFVVYHQFMIGCQKPRRPRFLLNEGELATTFTSLGFEVIEDRVFTISDGRPCSWFLARKKRETNP